MLNRLHPSPLLTRADLDRLLRETGADVYALSPACHPQAGVDVVYLGQAQLCLACHRCHGTFATLPLAEVLPPNRWIRHEEERP